MTHKAFELKLKPMTSFQKANLPFSVADEQKLMVELWDPSLADDPYKFVMFVFPWGKKGTPLEKFSGPRSWQREELMAMRDHIALQKQRMEMGLEPELYKSATASGRGIGKSSLTAWLIIWMLTTRIGSTVIVTANTETQLKSRTWAELGKWHTLAINSHWFEKLALSLKPAPWFEEIVKKQLKIDTGYYYAQAQLWSEENPDAFAGIHNHHGVFLLFDEASGIPAAIWSVSEGFFTEPVLDRYWLCFSNPRRNTGDFYECFHRYRRFWKRRNLDSRTVEGTDRKVLQDIIDKYGEDSDEARKEVKGQFPRVGDNQFISREDVENSMARDMEEDNHAALIMGVDPARFGDDEACIRFRQGRNARSVPGPFKFKSISNMALANKCAELIDKYKPDAVNVDAGAGAGVIDRLREMKYKVNEISFGSVDGIDPKYKDKRTEMWDSMKLWIPSGCLPLDTDLADDLCGPQYGYVGASDQLKLESKVEMKARGLASPDDGDSLALTFAVRVARRDNKLSTHSAGRGARIARDVDYNIFGKRN